MILPWLLLTAVPEPFVWERSLGPGVLYRAEIWPDLPLRVFALRVTPGEESLQLMAGLPGRTVYDHSATVGRGTTTQIAADARAHHAVNADFFPLSRDKATGDPLGFMAVAGELVSAPHGKRAAFAWGAQGGRTVYPQWTSSFAVEGESHAIEALNSECPLNDVALNTPTAGRAFAKEPALFVTVSMAAGARFTGSGTLEGSVTKIAETGDGDTVPAGHFVLAAQGSARERFARVRVGQKLTLRSQLAGIDLRSTPDAVGGGPRLVADGKAEVRTTAEEFGAAFESTRHPRTLIGVTAAKDMWLVVIDGRSPFSRGATLSECAQILLRLGVVDGINLDGGGSSALSLWGAAANRPSDGRERAIANGIALRHAFTPGSAMGLRIRWQSGRGTLLDAAGNAIPGREVIWQSEGDIVIDPDGTLVHRGPKGGAVRAVWRGAAVREVFAETTPAERPRAGTGSPESGPNRRPTTGPAPSRTPRGNLG
jgi:exopolysaccharide biosynthesis protein